MVLADIIEILGSSGIIKNSYVTVVLVEVVLVKYKMMYWMFLVDSEDIEGAKSVENVTAR